jgi:hypothetical protein
VTDRVAHRSRRDVSTRLPESVSKVVGECVQPGITKRRILGSPMRNATRSSRAVGCVRSPRPAIPMCRRRCRRRLGASHRLVVAISQRGRWLGPTLCRSGPGAPVAPRPALSGCHYLPPVGESICVLWRRRSSRRPFVARSCGGRRVLYITGCASAGYAAV